MSVHSLTPSTQSLFGGKYILQSLLCSKENYLLYLARVKQNHHWHRHVVLKMSTKGSCVAEARRLVGANTQGMQVFPTFYEVFAENEWSCLSREYIEGYTLHEYLKGTRKLRGRGRLSEEEVIAIGLPLAVTLQALHTRRLPMVYCGICPEHILLDTRQRGRIRLPDISVARYLPRASGHAPGVLSLRGSDGYVPPEYALGVVSPQTDVYALGTCLLEALSGKTAIPAWRVSRYSELEWLLQDMVKNDPLQRIQTMEEVVMRLQTLAQSSQRECSHTLKTSLARWLNQ